MGGQARGGGACVPSLLFDLRPNYCEGNDDNSKLLQKGPCMHCCTQCPQPPAGHLRPMPLLETPGPSRANLGQSLVGSLLLSPGSWCVQSFVCALQESVSPVHGVTKRWTRLSDFTSLLQTMVEVMKIMSTSFKRSHAGTAKLSAPSPAAGHHHPMPPPETPGHSRASLGQSLVGSLLLSPGSWCLQGFVCALQESVSPVLCKFWQLHGGVNGYFLQRGLCHTQVYCTQSPCPCSSPLLTCTSTGDTQTVLAQSLWDILPLKSLNILFYTGV